jgi:CIC family chloride channel protein
LTSLNHDEIPVVDPDDPSRLVGLLGRRELVAAYTREIEALRSPGAATDGEAGAAPPG